MTDPRTEAAREWVDARSKYHQIEGSSKYSLPATTLALLDYIVDMEKRLEQWQDYIKAEIERVDND